MPTALNQLARESSHYLLQHAHNPVDWHPWGEEVFVKARLEDKPIFLSIGYSTCHWCHVMAHECFENEAVAELMNRHLVNIKVDREERPDIDAIYMSACHVLGRRGGWPLSVFMGPDGRPFFIATYIPRESAFGRMGMLELIPRVATIWQEQRREALASGLQIEEALRANQGEACTVEEPDAQRGADEAFRLLAERFDPEHGGFGPAPKFPAPHNLLFLLNYAQRRENPKARAMVEATLLAMRLGGVFDHVGFGFHRYSTDARWLLPHFEKMLYDQAMLIMAYTEGWLVSENPLHRRTVAEIVAYVLDQLVTPDGVFGSGQDADSEGEEGKFYVWTRDELIQVLGVEQGEWVCERFNVAVEGNFQDEATGKRTGANILHLTEVMSDPGDQQRWEVLRNRLSQARSLRPRPLTDDAVLADWNGLLIAALARAGKVFEEPGWLETARGAADFILGRMRDAQGRVLHRLRAVARDMVQTGGPSTSGLDHLAYHVASQGFLDDQAFLVWGLLELYEVDRNPRYLAAAEEITDAQLQLFGDESHGGFFLTAEDGERLLFRPKEAGEGAMPSGNAVSAGNLLRLAEVTGNSIYKEQALNTAKAFGRLINTQPQGCTHWLSVLLDASR